MLLRLIILLTAIPVLEFYLILKVHHIIAGVWGTDVGVLVTMGTIVATGVAGARLASQQGLSVLRSIQKASTRGEMPTAALLDGAMVLVGGAMLLTPGFITDAFGLSLLLPLTRKLYAKAMHNWLRRKIERGQAVFYASVTPPTFENEPYIIDVESKPEKEQ